MSEPKLAVVEKAEALLAARSSARRHIDTRSARVPIDVPALFKQIGRPAITYRGARRNGARILGRKYRRSNMTDWQRPQECPHWWIGIRPNRVEHVTAGAPKGKAFFPTAGMASFFFTPAMRKAFKDSLRSTITSIPGFGRFF